MTAWIPDIFQVKLYHEIKSRNEQNSTKFYIPFYPVENGNTKDNFILTINLVVQE